MIGKQLIRRDITIDYSSFQSLKGSVVADSEEEGDNNNLFESAADNNHSLLIQPMPLLVPSEITSPLTDIFRANTPLPLETFSDPANEEDIPELPNTL